MTAQFREHKKNILLRFLHANSRWSEIFVIGGIVKVMDHISLSFSLHRSIIFGFGDLHSHLFFIYVRNNINWKKPNLHFIWYRPWSSNPWQDKRSHWCQLLARSLGHWKVLDEELWLIALNTKQMKSFPCCLIDPRHVSSILPRRTTCMSNCHNSFSPFFFNSLQQKPNFHSKFLQIIC